MQNHELTGYDGGGGPPGDSSLKKRLGYIALRIAQIADELPAHDHEARRLALLTIAGHGQTIAKVARETLATEAAQHVDNVVAFVAKVDVVS